jgi:ABC-type cobalamin transport system ATPase subunit
VGGSGAGKSTLMRVLAGLYAAPGVWVAGRLVEIAPLHELRERQPAFAAMLSGIAHELPAAITAPTIDYNANVVTQPSQGNC